MGSSTSKPTPETQHILEQAGQVSDDGTVVPPQQVQAIEKLSTEQKNALSKELQQLQKRTEQQIKHIRQQGEHAKIQQAQVEANVDAEIKNIEEQKKQKAKAIIKEHTSKKSTKSKLGIHSKCKEWKNNKNINPTTGKPLKKGAVLKTLKNVCKNQKTRKNVCKNPNVSLKTGKPYSEKSSTKKLLNKLCEN